MFNHLIDIKSLDVQTILELVSAAKAFKSGDLAVSLQGQSAVTMFLEPSTRTKCSFELAAKRLGLDVLDFEASKSSFSKGETLIDTLHNLCFIGINAVIIRSGECGLIKQAVAELKYPIHLVNAGEGNLSHPTQALLDFMTMTEKLDSVEGKKVVIAGDIKHSRVAKSNIELLNKFGADINLCAPKYFRDESLENVTWHDDLAEAIAVADVVMVLRTQKERHESLEYSFEEYVEKYQLTTQKIEKLAPKAILMHPGPVNRDAEITSELLDSKKGITILEQARNGTFMRMAVLNKLLGGRDNDVS